MIGGILTIAYANRRSRCRRPIPHDASRYFIARGCGRLLSRALVFAILDEVTRNLISDYGMEPARAGVLRTVMEEAFPDANVEDWEPLEPAMWNHPKDRHVAAAAAAVGAGIIVTSNIRDFRDLPSGIVAMTPDDFLVSLLSKGADRLLEALVAQAAGYRRPTLSVVELMERLSGIAPEFAAKTLSISIKAK